MIDRRIVSIIASRLIITAGIIITAACAAIRPSQIKADLPEETAQSREERTVKALAAAYPLRIEKAEFINDDWAVLMDGVWYYYAGGKMLPEKLREQAEKYSGAYDIPNYPAELPPWTEPTPEQVERYRGRNTGNNANNRNNNSGNTEERPRAQPRSNHFSEALWQAASRSEASQRMQNVNFFGYTISVHSGIVGVLDGVKERITAAAKVDPRAQSWISDIGEVYGWNWRNIAASQSRSNHSYGIAVDILPKSLNGKETYWLWAAQKGKEWWNVPYEDRYHPPDAVIKAFEAYGFIWGGKWIIFDTMHFEYRPEVLIFNGFEIATATTPTDA